MANEYKVKIIGEKTYAIEEKSKLNQGLCYLLCGDEKALLIDTGFGYPSLKNTVNNLTELPIIVADTHAHVDHIGGNHYFEEIWFHEKDKETFKKHCNPKYTLDTLTDGLSIIIKPIYKILMKKRLSIDSTGNYCYFGDDKKFYLGNRTVEVIPTPGHTAGSVCFLDRENRMLFSGDTICEWGILLHLKGESCSAETYMESVERLIKHENEFDTIWPGHHGYPVDKKYLREYLECAKSITGNTAVYKKVKGRIIAVYKDIVISVPEK